jgi:hypothetical protein
MSKKNPQPNDLFKAMVRYLHGQMICEDGPTDVVLKETRQFLKDFGFMAVTGKVAVNGNAQALGEKLADLYPFPASFSTGG